MKKVLLVAVNARFIHSNPAVYTLARYADKAFNPESGGRAFVITPLEFSIQDKISYILGEITDARADTVGFSCYVWNITLIKALVAAIKKVTPGTLVILGGPEVSFDALAVLRECPADIIVCGEGEAAFAEILSAKPLAEIQGIVYRDANSAPLAPRFITPPPREKHVFAAIPFPYTDAALPANKIVYYESTRGCPFTCGFCLSHSEKPVRFLPLERVFTDLDFFLARRVNQVKFTDRTFNCDSERAERIWRYLIEHDNGHTNFHFEVSADFLDEGAVNVLRHAPAGLFQLEIGIQSTHAPTLEAIRRFTDTQAVLANCKRLQEAAPHVHTHLDLIAGLPGEGMDDFRTSFNDVYALRPDMLQLGFLKLLKGSRLRDEAETHGIIYHDTPPYEVLQTSHITYAQLKTLKDIENALDTLYNSGYFKKTLPYIEGLFADSFELYASFVAYWKAHGYHRAAQGLPRVFEILYAFALANKDEKSSDVNFNRVIKNLLRYDWYASGNRQNPPTRLYNPTPGDIKKVDSLYKTYNLPRRCLVVGFDIDPRGGDAAPRAVYLCFTRTGKPRPGAQGKIIETRCLSDDD